MMQRRALRAAATLTHERLHKLRVVGDVEELTGAQRVGEGVIQLTQVIEHLHATTPMHSMSLKASATFRVGVGEPA
jgi:hypothetical protein